MTDDTRPNFTQWWTFPRGYKSGIRLSVFGDIRANEADALECVLGAIEQFVAQREKAEEDA